MVRNIFLAFTVFAVIVIAALSLSGAPRPAMHALGSADDAAVMVAEADSARLLQLVDLKGGHVILTFWESNNPESRIRANEYDRLVRAVNNPGQLALVSVNLDHNQKLFQEIARRDGLDPSTLRRPASAKASANLLSRYRLDSGNLRSYLISPDGRITAVNPDAASVRRLMDEPL